jgi:hypothetical protein
VKGQRRRSRSTRLRRRARAPPSDARITTGPAPAGGPSAPRPLRAARDGESSATSTRAVPSQCGACGCARIHATSGGAGAPMSPTNEPTTPIEFRRAKFDDFQEADRDALCARLAATITKRLASDSHVHDLVGSVVSELRALGHDLWSFDEDGDTFEVWCPNYAQPTGPGLVITFRSDGPSDIAHRIVRPPPRGLGRPSCARPSRRRAKEKRSARAPGASGRCRGPYRPIRAPCTSRG